MRYLVCPVDPSAFAPFAWENRGVQFIGRRIAADLAAIHHRVDVQAPYPLPLDSPAIIVANHTSYVDPLFIQWACPRLIAWLIAREYAQMPGADWICRKIGTIPVDRGGRDLAATRAALAALESGRVIGIFAEGRIQTQRQLLPFQEGVALLAIRSGAPVVPTFVDGTQRYAQSLWEAWWQPQHAVLRFGEPLRFEPSAGRWGLSQATRRIEAAVGEIGNLLASDARKVIVGDSPKPMPSTAQEGHIEQP